MTSTFMDSHITPEEMIKVLQEETTKDMVNHPDHYTRTEREVIDTMRGAMTEEEFTGYLKGNILKYTLRIGLKDSVSQEAGKIKAYTDYLEMHLNDEWVEGAH